MQLSKLSLGIIKLINRKYDNQSISESLDIKTTIDICKIYNDKNENIESISLTDIKLSSPDFIKGSPQKKLKTKFNSKKDTAIYSSDFQKKYAFFIRIIYSCLKMNIEIFTETTDSIIIKNNYKLIKTLESKKKELIKKHINVLDAQYKNPTKYIDDNYNLFFTDNNLKINMIDNILKSLRKLINLDIFNESDNLFTLIVPYFYKYTEYIEEYNVQ